MNIPNIISQHAKRNAHLTDAWCEWTLKHVPEYDVMVCIAMLHTVVVFCMQSFNSVVHHPDGIDLQSVGQKYGRARNRLVQVVHCHFTCK